MPVRMWVCVSERNRGPQEERPWAPHAWLPASQLSLVHKRILCFCLPPCELSRPWGGQKRHVRTSEGRVTTITRLTLHLQARSAQNSEYGEERDRAYLWEAENLRKWTFCALETTRSKMPEDGNKRTQRAISARYFFLDKTVTKY